MMIDGYPYPHESHRLIFAKLKFQKLEGGAAVAATDQTKRERKAPILLSSLSSFDFLSLYIRPISLLPAFSNRRFLGIQSNPTLVRFPRESQLQNNTASGVLNFKGAEFGGIRGISDGFLMNSSVFE